MNTNKPFITVYESVSGWKAVHYWFNDKEEDLPEGFWEPCNTGFGSYATKEEASVEAKEWAEAEGIEYRETD
jgi:hypothetical protein